MLQPIWQDYYLTVTEPTLQVLEYELREGNEFGALLHKGRAIRRPNEDDFRIKLNEVVADYLRSDLPEVQPETFTIDRITLDVVAVYASGQGSQVATPAVTFVKNWSYDYNRAESLENYGLSDPITGEIQGYHPLFVSLYAGQHEIVSYDIAGEEIDVRTVNASKAGVYCITADSAVSTYVVDGGLTYTVVPFCGEGFQYRFTLYYENAWGGWDFLMLKGNHKEADELTRYESSKEYDNSVQSNRGKDNFVNEIAKMFTLNTGWLTDEQAGRMHHLLNSTNVYMLDNQQGYIWPLILRGNTTEYKTFKTEGGLVNYTLEVEVAQNMQRR